MESITDVDYYGLEDEGIAMGVNPPPKAPVPVSQLTDIVKEILSASLIDDFERRHGLKPGELNEIRKRVQAQKGSIVVKGDNNVVINGRNLTRKQKLQELEKLKIKPRVSLREKLDKTLRVLGQAIKLMSQDKWPNFKELWNESPRTSGGPADNAGAEGSPTGDQAPPQGLAPPKRYIRG